MASPDPELAAAVRGLSFYIIYWFAFKSVDLSRTDQEMKGYDTQIYEQSKT